MAQVHDSMMNPKIEDAPRARSTPSSPWSRWRLDAGPPDQLLLRPAGRRASAPSCRRRSPRWPASRCRSPSRRSPPTRSWPSPRRGRPASTATAEASTPAEPTAGSGRMLAGARIVLGVSGGIAAYKAIEVCRRLVDAGAHVAPVLTAGRHPLRRARPRSRRWPPSRCRPRCGTSADPIPHTRLGQRADVVVVVPGHRPADRRLRRRHLRRPAHRHPAGHPGAGGGVPGHAHRDVGAPGGAGQPGHAAPPRRARRRARRRAAWPAATSGPGRLADPADIVGRGRAPSCGPRRPRRACACSSPPAAPASRSTRCASSPTARRASRATPSPSEPRPAGAKVTLVTTVDRPVAARHRRGRRWRRAAEMEAAVVPRSGRRRRHRHGRGRGRLPARRRRPTASSRRATASPEIVLEPTPDILADLGRGQAGRARCWSASRPRPTTCVANAREKLARKGLDLIVANDVAAPGVGFEHDTNAGRDHHGRRRRA